MFGIKKSPTTLHSSSSVRFGLKFALTALLFGSMNNFQAANLTVDFRKLYPQNDEHQFLTPEEIKEYFETLDSPSVIVSGITVANMTFGYSNGIGKIWSYYSNDGAIFIQSTDPQTKEDTGQLSLIIEPSNRHRNTNLNFYIYKDPTIVSSQDIPAKLEVSINGQPYQEATRTDNKNNIMATFNIKPNGAIIKEISIRVPNACRNKKDNTLSPADEDYFMAFTHINLYYGEETSQPVTSWLYETDNQTVDLSQADNYIMPVLKSVPEEAVNVALYTSSNPEVAEIKNERVILKSAGVTYITAELPSNSLFHESSGYHPASYLLTVTNENSSIGNVVEETVEHTTYYNIQGIPISSHSIPGVYIRKTGNRTEKISIR